MVGAEGMISPAPIGLDYPAVYNVAETLDFEITPAALQKLQALEFYEIKRNSGEENDGG